MTFLGSERGTGSAVACMLLGIMGVVWEQVDVFVRPLLGTLGMVGACEEVDVEARGILFTYGSTYLE